MTDNPFAVSVVLARAYSSGADQLYRATQLWSPINTAGPVMEAKLLNAVLGGLANGKQFCARALAAADEYKQLIVAAVRSADYFKKLSDDMSICRARVWFSRSNDVNDWIKAQTELRSLVRSLLPIDARTDGTDGFCPVLCCPLVYRYHKSMCHYRRDWKLNCGSHSAARESLPIR
jgi:hypothetical protein